MRAKRASRLLSTGVGLALLVLSLAPAAASSANISHSYRSTASIPNGSLVSLDSSRSDYVQLANTDNGSRLIGVAVAKDDSLLAVDPANGSVQVATTGNATSLVSNLNGDIKVGDQISVSPFSGIGMKALPGLYVVGLAQEAFNQASPNAHRQTVTDKQGRSSQIEIGYVRVNVAVGRGTNGGGNQPLNSLQKIGQALTGRVISTPRLIIGLIVTFVATLSLVTLMYASIYGSIISVGRNPLAKYAVFRTLGSVMGLAVLTAGIAGVTLFLLLR